MIASRPELTPKLKQKSIRVKGNIIFCGWTISFFVNVTTFERRASGQPKKIHFDLLSLYVSCDFSICFICILCFCWELMRFVDRKIITNSKHPYKKW